MADPFTQFTDAQGRLAGAVGTAGGFIAAGVQALATTILRPYRAIQPFPDEGPAEPIVADAVVEERHHDELVITEHPVEQGASITDHAYKLPAEVVLTYGWTSSKVTALADPAYLQNLYKQLLQLQIDRVLFSVFTGKRSYTNMLMKALSLDTTERTENAILVKMVCRQVLMATTVIGSVTTSNEVQADSAVNGAVLDRGGQSTRQVTGPQ